VYHPSGPVSRWTGLARTNGRGRLVISGGALRYDLVATGDGTLYAINAYSGTAVDGQAFPILNENDHRTLE
jgi:hypothetical protein